MSVLYDLTTEISNYAAQNVQIMVRQVNWQMGAPNPNDWAVCAVRVSNNGDLGMQSTVLMVQCSEHATASLLPPPVVGSVFGPTLVLPVGAVAAHGTADFSFFIRAAKVTAPAGSAEQLFRVYLQGHDLTLDPLLKDHTGSVQSVAATYSTAVFPQ